MGGWPGLQPGAALVVVRLAIVTLPPCSTAPAVSGCRLVGYRVVSGLSLYSSDVSGVSQCVAVSLGPVLASCALPPPDGRHGVGFPVRGGVWTE